MPAGLIEKVNPAEREDIAQNISQRDKHPTKYPKSVAFFITNEFCDRFTYYGLRTILALYLTTKLHYDKDTATVLYHSFTMSVYLFPIVGAVIADCWWGKFKTILYSLVCLLFEKVAVR